MKQGSLTNSISTSMIDQIFATTDDGSCSYECAAVEGPCMFDVNNDGSIGSADLLDFLTAFGVSRE